MTLRSVEGLSGNGLCIAEGEISGNLNQGELPLDPVSSVSVGVPGMAGHPAGLLGWRFPVSGVLLCDPPREQAICDLGSLSRRDFKEEQQRAAPRAQQDGGAHHNGGGRGCAPAKPTSDARQAAPGQESNPDRSWELGTETWCSFCSRRCRTRLGQPPAPLCLALLPSEPAANCVWGGHFCDLGTGDERLGHLPSCPVWPWATRPRRGPGVVQSSWL